MHCPLLVIIFVTSRLFPRGSIVEEITEDSRSEFSSNRPNIFRAFCSHQLELCSRVITNIGWSHLHIMWFRTTKFPWELFEKTYIHFPSAFFVILRTLKFFMSGVGDTTPLLQKWALIPATRTRLHANTNCVPLNIQCIRTVLKKGCGS